MSYDPFFQTLHDELHPVGNFGHGSHYSVLRVPIWHDKFMKKLDFGALLDFAIIWDEDHDARIIEPIRELYFSGLLAPVRYIGERKGALSVLLETEVVKAWDGATFERYRSKVGKIAQNLDDPWAWEVDSVDSREHSIIYTADDDVAIYLKNIDVLWQLGIKRSQGSRIKLFDA